MQTPHRRPVARRFTVRLSSTVLAAVLALTLLTSVRAGATDDDHFEKRIRPMLSEHCWKCHGKSKQEGGLRLDSAASVRSGGDSGNTVVPGEPDRSLLIQAVRQTTELKMPPDGHLTTAQIADLEAWIRAGAAWPDESHQPQDASDDTGVMLLEPNAGTLAESLQLWLKADGLGYADEQPVFVWPDQSSHGRDLSATAGVRPGGTGTPPLFSARSRILGHPAVRFAPENGLAGSPDHLPDIHGDAAATIFIVCYLEPCLTGPPYDNLLMIGNPAWPGDPGGPRALYLELDHSGAKPALDLGGGWNHDASLGPGSAELVYSQPRLVTVTKTPGPMTAGTRFYFEGKPSEQILNRAMQGTEAVPDVQYRDDFGMAIGKPTAWAGSIQGDIAEVIVYNRVLPEVERRGVEAHLLAKYGLLTTEMFDAATRTFSDEEKSHWSFQPIGDPDPPHVSHDEWPASAIDTFVLAKLEAHGLSPAPAADRRTLIRRVTYDLIGLPPTPDEVDMFLVDAAPDELAFERVVERLLASRHYGERWGRHWLDAVRYADTTANDGNFVMRFAYRYREYVVDAFNDDMPYTEFLTEQLAGDLLPHDDPRIAARRTIATGFLMVGPKALAETDKEQVRMDIVDEQLDVIGRSMMGLTISCARCHDHKFDPIPTVDYYSLAGILRSTEMFSDLQRNASKWMEYSIPAGPDGATIEVMAPKEGVPRHVCVHQRGSRFRLGQVAPRRFLQVLAGPGHRLVSDNASGRLELARWIASPGHPLTARVMVNRIWQGHFGVGLVSTSDDFGRRGAIASHPELLDWLASRFIASDWSVKAMHRLILNSRTYRMSTQADPRHRTNAESADPENRWLWRAPRRRLDAEQLRDSLLAVSGELDRRIGGGDLTEQLYAAAEVLDKDRGVASASTINSRWDGFDSSRRSLYLPVVRNGLPDVLAIFDAADPNAVTARRNETTVPSQAAFLLNNPFATQRAAAFARRVTNSSDDRMVRIRLAYQLALSRLPADDEISAGSEFLDNTTHRLRKTDVGTDEAESAAWTRFCQLLFCLNEFLYVE